MQAPDAAVEGQGLIVLSSEPGETDHNNDKTLKDLGLVDGCALLVDDYLQNYEVRVRLVQNKEEKSWKLLTDPDALPLPGPTEDVQQNDKQDGMQDDAVAGPSKAHEDEDFEIVEEIDDQKPAKRARTDDVMVVE